MSEAQSGKRFLLEARGEPYRLRCPEGHTRVRSKQSGGFYCNTCKEPYDYAVDSKEGIRLTG